MRPPFDAILWWELRRLPYNLVLLAVGILTITIIVLVGDELFAPDAFAVRPPAILFGVICYGIMANILYTSSWITEILWSGGDTSRTEPLRARVFRTGLACSVVLTLLPAVLVPAGWLLLRSSD